MKNNLLVTLPISIILASSLTYAQSGTTAASTTTVAAPQAVITKTTQPVATQTIMLPNGKKTVTTKTTTTITKPLAGVSTAKVEAPKADEGGAKFGMGIGIEYATQAQVQEDGTRTQGLSFEFNPSVSVGEYTLIALEYFNQDLIETAGPSWTDPYFAVSKKAWAIGDYLTLGPSLNLTIPMTEASKNEVGLIYNAGAKLKLGLKTAALGMDAFSLAYSVQYNRNFLEFDTNAKTNAPNNLYRLRNQIEAGYNITDSLSFSTMFRYDSNYTVNNVVTGRFLSTQGLSYSVNDNLSLSVSHGNAGAALDDKSDYVNNVKLYNPKSSEVSMAVGLSL